MGPGRYARPSFRLREGLKPNIKYSKVYFKVNKIIGSIRYFNCRINNQSGLMLGPLIVDQSFKGKGIGRELMNQSMSSINLNSINLNSINFIILIGELNYYGQFNFEVNTNIYFAINVRQEKILFKKLLDKNNTFSGKIELY